MGKKRKRDEESSSSESESEPPKKKRKKKKKKRKASRSSSPVKKKKAKKQKGLDLAQLGVDPISEDDYFRKNAVFRSYMFEVKHKYFDKLSSKKAMKKFKKFVQKWNDGLLPEKFYKDRTTQSLHALERSSHKWSFEKTMSKADRMQLQSARDSVDNYTNESQMHQEIEVQFEQKRAARKKRERRHKEQENEDKAFEDHLDKFEDKQQNIYDREERKKRWRRQNKMVEEELVPKKEGFARRVEKRHIKHRQNDDSDFGGQKMSHFGGDDRGLEFFKRKRNDRDKDRFNLQKKNFNKERKIANSFKEFGY